MASYTGILLPSATVSSALVALALAVPDPALGFMPTASLAAGALTDTQPVTEPAAGHTGVDWPGYGFLDFFNRIHFSETAIDVGNLVSSQERHLYVFNAYFVDRQLSGVSSTGAGGIELTPPAAYPITMPPFTELDFVLSIGAVGPPAIDATFTFDLDVPDQDVTIVGRRVIPWFVPPNWSSPVLERLRWKTDVIPHFDGSEQRIGLRPAGARWEWEFDFDALDRQARTLENALYAWGARVWALPIWPEGEALGATLAAGSTVIPCTPALRDYHVGGLAIILNGGDFEAFEVAAVGAGSITAALPTTREWNGSSQVFPARTARLMDRVAATRRTGVHIAGTARFRCEEAIARTAETETTYRGFPVLTRKPNWEDDPEATYARRMAEIDLEIGGVSWDDETGLPDVLFGYRVTPASRNEIEDLRAFLFARQGRRKAIWVPSFARDVIVVTDPIASGAVNIDVEACGFTDYVEAGVNRRDLRIEMRNGTVYYRRVSGSSKVDEDTERLTLDTPLGVTIAATDIAAISFMALARLDQDGVEIAYWSGDVADARLGFRTVRSSA